MAAVVAAQRPVQREFFSLSRRTLAIDIDDAGAAHILGTTYADARTQEVRSLHHTASMRRLSDGRLHVRFDRRTLAFGEASPQLPLLSAYYATKEVFARFSAGNAGSVAFYGALIAVNGAGVLILGPTAIGKTILALHMSALGAEFLGDETAVLDLRSTTICALARKPALRESALGFLPTLEMRSCVSGARDVIHTDHGRFWYALSARDLCGIAPNDRAYPLAAVCIIRERAQTFASQRIHPMQALPSLVQRAYARPSQLTQVANLRRAMRTVALFEIALADPKSTAAAVLAEVAACV